MLMILVVNIFLLIVLSFVFFLFGEVNFSNLLFVQLICHQLKTCCQYLNICYKISLSASECHGISDFTLCKDEKADAHYKKYCQSFTLEVTPENIFFLLKVEKLGRKKISSLYKDKYEDWIKSLDVFFCSGTVACLKLQSGLGDSGRLKNDHVLFVLGVNGSAAHDKPVETQPPAEAGGQ